MNEGGYRTDLRFHSDAPGVPDGKITYGELFGTQPFGNLLVTMTLTGAQIKTMLEEQFKGCALGAPPGSDPPTGDRTLVVSQGFAYTYSKLAAPCHKVDAGSIKLRGAAIVPSARYRVTVNNFLADGGAQFPVLKEGADRVVGLPDVDALAAYFATHPFLQPVQTDRITVIP
jgi:5'-nucleotidase